MLPTTFETHGENRRLRVARLGTGAQRGPCGATRESGGAGSQGAPLVLLHGYPENLQIWCELAPRLSERFQVIAFDWPGMGYSDAWRGGTTPEHMAGRLRALLDAWGIERATLMGMDMGGQPALVFAARYPERISHLIVQNSLVLWDEETSWEIRVLRRFGWNRLILRRLPWIVFRRAERTFLPRGVRLPRTLRADFWQSFRREEVRRFIIRMCAGYQGTLPRLPALYEQIACPTLILWGERDRHFPPAHAERLHALIGGSRLEILPGGEHWMSWYLAPETAQRICRFVDEHPG